MRGITQRDAAQRETQEPEAEQGHRIQRCYLPCNADVMGHDDTSYPIRLLSNHYSFTFGLYSLQAPSYSTLTSTKVSVWQSLAAFSASEPN